jgi:hypothetical protein
MSRIIMCAAVGALFIGSVARADETLKWRHVQHSTSNQTQQVGDGHAISLFRIIGLAFFPDGSTGTTLAVGTNDVTNGVGGISNGYFTLTFADGSELSFKYTGTSKLGGPKIALKGTDIVIGGKGRYAGAKGDGTWEGEATAYPGGEGISYIDNVVNIKK